MSIGENWLYWGILTLSVSSINSVKFQKTYSFSYFQWSSSAWAKSDPEPSPSLVPAYNRQISSKEYSQWWDTQLTHKESPPSLEFRFDSLVLPLLFSVFKIIIFATELALLVVAVELLQLLWSSEYNMNMNKWIKCILKIINIIIEVILLYQLLMDLTASDLNLSPHQSTFSQQKKAYGSLKYNGVVLLQPF